MQIGDLDDEVYSGLRRDAAAAAGMSVSAFLRREAGPNAARPTVGEWLARTGRRTSDLTSLEVLDALDESRGPWPDAGR